MPYKTIRTNRHIVDGIPVVIKRKNIRNMYLRVDRNTGDISVSSPLLVRTRTIEAFIRNNQAWITKNKRAAERRPKNPELPSAFTDGSYLEIFGHKKSLRIISGQKRNAVELVQDELHVHCKQPDSDKIRHVIDRWLRESLRNTVAEIKSTYEPLMNVKVQHIGIKKMKTRWGSCNVRAGRIWLNASLIHMDRKFLEMVVVHEMVHLLEPSHNKRFYALMEHYLPGFRNTEDALQGKIH